MTLIATCDAVCITGLLQHALYYIMFHCLIIKINNAIFPRYNFHFCTILYVCNLFYYDYVCISFCVVKD